MAARFKAWVRGRKPAGIAGSNPTGGRDVCRECCVLSGRRSLQRADHSSRGLLLTVVCLSVIVEPEKLGGLGPSRAVESRQKEIHYNKVL